MRTHRRGFTLIELLIVVVIVGILALAALPLVTSNTRDARRSEGEQLLGAARDYCRAQYAKAANVTEVNLAFSNQQANGAFTGEYYNVASFANSSTVSGMDASIKTDNGNDGTGTMDFAWNSGSSQITWN